MLNYPEIVGTILSEHVDAEFEVSGDDELVGVIVREGDKHWALELEIGRWSPNALHTLGRDVGRLAVIRREINRRKSLTTEKD